LVIDGRTCRRRVIEKPSTPTAPDFKRPMASGVVSLKENLTRFIGRDSIFFTLQRTTEGLVSSQNERLNGLG